MKYVDTPARLFVAYISWSGLGSFVPVTHTVISFGGLLGLELIIVLWIEMLINDYAVQFLA